jgi:subtilase family serine protease
MSRLKSAIVLITAIVSISVLRAQEQEFAPSIPKVESRRVCAPSTNPHIWSCMARVVTSSLEGLPKASGVVGMASPSGFGPADLQDAYKLTSLSASAGSGRTIAIVDAYDDTKAEADLAVYRSTFGLPPCTSASGCFQKVNEFGASSPLPPTDTTGWSEEISLDLDMASAICPNCNLLLVEANGPFDVDLINGVNTAAAWSGVIAISNSYGGSEDSSITSECSSSVGAYNHPGVAITVSSGDEGYGAEFPASCTYVTAVGGTSLSKNSSVPRGWSETVWETSSSEGTGSGCSAFMSKPSWQTDTGCTKRTIGDVSADADPATGVAVYDTAPNSDGVNGWAQFGGTSVSAPLIAGVYALASPPASGDYPSSYAYANTSAFFDVTSGHNGTCTGHPYWCTAEPGYDGPTGWGTPNGVGGFEPPASVGLTPASLNFGKVAVNNTSAVKIATLKNTGTATVNINNISASSNFAVSSTTCAGTLLSGNSCKVKATFTPSGLGPLTGTLTFTDNAAGSPQAIALSGTGIVQATLAPASTTYAKQAVGTTSAAKTFTLTNNQNVALTSIAISTTGDFAVSTTGCGTSLGAKSKCTISVTFTPTAAGTRTGQLLINEGQGISPQTSNLKGTGK